MDLDEVATSARKLDEARDELHLARLSLARERVLASVNGYSASASSR